jgi:SAM-dependent methyltransferase
MDLEPRIDCLTPQTLQASHKSWWDEAFTRLVLDMIPFDTRCMVELDCGLAGAAHTLLPSLPSARYLGVDFNPERLGEAKRAMEETAIAARAELRLSPSESLPLADGSADVVLSVMSLQHKADVPAVLREAWRVLRPRGRLVCVEPDNLGQRYYFDGGLEEITIAFHALTLRARVARQPADIALGPRLPTLMAEAGLRQIQVRAHMVASARSETAAAYFGRLQRLARAIAEEAGLAVDGELVEACDAAVRRCLFSGIPKRVGYSCHIVPVFLCAGQRI